MIILLISLGFLFLSVTPYNLDTKYPVIYADPSKSNAEVDAPGRGSYFGYSVFLVAEFGKLEPQLYIGAPRANSSNIGKSVKEPGIVYNCSLSRKCQAISPTSDSLSDIALERIGRHAKIIQDNSWFGMSISAIHPTLLKICAPRTKIHLFKPFTNEYIESMHGVCYYYHRSIENSFLLIDIESLNSYDFSTPYWYNPLHGFSMHVAVGISPTIHLNMQEKNKSIIKTLLSNVSMIIGNPTNNLSGSISIVQKNKINTLDISNDEHKQFEFGYAVTSGKYFQRNEIVFASGAPAWKFTGKVEIMKNSADSRGNIYTIDGQQMGEYFGASLVSGDLNNDGFDDLIIGAPHYGDDVGRVYIYFGSQNRFQDYRETIEGSVKGAKFGYSLSCGDLDNDGYLDLIVGAPWDEFGAIYVYNGNSIIEEERNLQMTQKISASELSSKLQGFGFSISNLADVDNNGFLDVAIGAYKTDRVVLLRAKPVERPKFSLKARETSLKRDSREISTEVCLTNEKKSTHSEVLTNYTVKLIIDPKYKRFTNDYVIWNIAIGEQSRGVARSFNSNNWDGCSFTYFSLKSDIENFVDPVDLILTYALNSYRRKQQNNASYFDQFCKMCPIKYMERDSKPVKLFIPFDIACDNDKVCSPDISVTSSIFGVGANNTWEIGSGDIAIEAKLENFGDPAHSVRVNFFIPKGLHLRNVLSFCQEDISDVNILIVTCNVGNEFDKGAQKIIRLDLDMMDFQIQNFANIEEQKFFINMTLTSRSHDHATKGISIPVLLKTNVSSSITGKTDKDSYYLTNGKENTVNITFQHIYSIYKHGSTPISKGKIVIEIPIQIQDNDPFILLERPQLQTLGTFHNCSISRDNPLPPKPSAAQLHIEQLFNNDIASKKPKRQVDKFKDKSTNRSSEIGKIKDSIKSNKFSIDCSNDIIQCIAVECNLIHIKSAQDVGTVALTLKLKLNLLRQAFDTTPAVIQFHTMAHLHVESTVHSNLTNVLTTFYNIKESNENEQINIWVILTSLTIGLFILSIIVSALYFIGFFQKKQKLKLNFVNLRNHDDEAEDISVEETTEQEIL